MNSVLILDPEIGENWSGYHLQLINLCGNQDLSCNRVHKLKFERQSPTYFKTPFKVFGRDTIIVLKLRMRVLKPGLFVFFKWVIYQHGTEVNWTITMVVEHWRACLNLRALEYVCVMLLFHHPAQIYSCLCN